MTDPIRGGNRGGADQFKWENVRQLPYKEREVYLGYSAQLGYLDKGGSWKKRRWDPEPQFKANEDEQRNELQDVQAADLKRMRQALGMIEPEAKLPAERLSKSEISSLQALISGNQNANNIEEEEKSDDQAMAGLGHNDSKSRTLLALDEKEYLNRYREKLQKGQMDEDITKLPAENVTVILDNGPQYKNTRNIQQNDYEQTTIAENLSRKMYDASSSMSQTSKHIKKSETIHTSKGKHDHHPENDKMHQNHHSRHHSSKHDHHRKYHH